MKNLLNNKRIQNILSSSSQLPKLIRYFSLRGFTFVLNIALIAFLVEIVNFNYKYAYIFSLILIMLVNYVLGAMFVFKTSFKKANAFLYFLITIGLVYFSSFLLKPLVEGLKFHYLIASIISIAIIFIIKFIALDKLVFKTSS